MSTKTFEGLFEELQAKAAAGTEGSRTVELVAAGVHAIGLHRPRADAVAADVRVAERDDLSGIARVAHRLLVPGHRRVEDQLASRDSTRRHRTGSLAFQDVAGGENKCSRLAGSLRRFSSSADSV